MVCLCLSDHIDDVIVCFQDVVGLQIGIRLDAEISQWLPFLNLHGCSKRQLVQIERGFRFSISPGGLILG